MQEIHDEHGRPIQLTDEFGRPVQLTDEHGVPVHLTGVATTEGHTTIGSELHDKITPGGATTQGGHATIGSELRHKTTHDQTPDATMGSETHGGTHFAPTPVDYLKRGADAVAGAGAATVGAAAGAAKGAVTGLGAPVSHTQAHHGVGGDEKEVEGSPSSTSTSEDDGEGGRRKKKGLMQKIKEKLPGRHKKEKEKQATAHSADTKVSSAGGVPAAGTRVEHHEQEHEKKGTMDKIKEKLPGHH